MRISYLGPPGTHTESAAIEYDPNAQLMPYATVQDAVSAVERDEADLAICAIENALEGAVIETLIILQNEILSVNITAEIVIPIKHALVGIPGQSLEKIATVHSHPQALAQCRESLVSLVPNAKPVAALSTAAAIDSASQNPNTLAIGNIRAASPRSLHVYNSDISDNKNNQTRFIALGKNTTHPTGDDKTSLVFTMAYDMPGSLVDVLLPFAQRKINLSKIESRPTRQQLGTYYFFVDIHGHRDDVVITDAIKEAQPKTQWLNILGSYPRWNYQTL